MTVHSAPPLRSDLFFAVEVDLYRPGSTTVTIDEGWMGAPWLALAVLPDQPPGAEALRASDAGWRTAASDPEGVQVYPPLLSAAPSIDRAMVLAPGGAGAAAAWGDVQIINDGGELDALAAPRNADGRAIRLRAGRKTYDRARGLWRDPPLAETRELLVGLGAGWLLEERTLRIGLRDATYWLERPVDGSVYLGTGGLEGTAELKGRRRPITRGGTPSAPVREVSPVLVDPAALIYQYSDAPGTVVALYEGGDAQIPYAGDTTNLYAGSTPPGHYRTDNGRALIQLGSLPARRITVDATGGFVGGGAATTAAALAKRLLLDDLALPAEALDEASLDALDAAYPWTAGVHVAADEPLDGAGHAGLLLASLGARLVPGRDGRLRAVALRAPDIGGTPAATYTAAQIVSVAARPLGAPLDPPPYRWRVGYARAYTVQTSDLDPDVTAERRQFLAEAWRIASWSSSEVINAYRRPSDPPLVETALLEEAHAEALAAALGDLWTSGFRLYDVTLPLDLALERDLGERIGLAYPLGPLTGGRTGLIVGEQIRAAEQTAILQVLA